MSVFSSVLAFLRQPTNLHAFGVIAGGVAGGLAHITTGNPTIDTVVAVLVFVLSQFAINDNTKANSAVAALVKDSIVAAESKKLDVATGVALATEATQAATALAPDSKAAAEAASLLGIVSSVVGNKV